MRKRILRRGPAAVFAALVLIVSSGCSETGTHPGRQAGSIVSVSACKDMSSVLSFDKCSAGLECFEYEYDGDGVLDLRHTNSSLNCCPGTIAADISVENSVITIIESEEGGAQLCDCMCLYDIEYRFEDLEAGEYTVIFVSSGSQGLEPLEADISLDGPSSGMRCIERTSYPWF